MKLKDRVWLWMNRKEQKPSQSYLQVVILWTIYGWLLGMGMLLLTVAPKAWPIGAALLAFSLFMLYWFYRSDKKKGIVNLLHQHWLQRWYERREAIKGRA